MANLRWLLVSIAAVLLAGCGGNTPTQSSQDSGATASVAGTSALPTPTTAAAPTTAASRPGGGNVAKPGNQQMPTPRRKVASKHDTRSEHAAVPGGYSLFKSENGGYSLAYPEDWHAQRNFMNMNMGAKGRATVDMIVRPQDGSNVTIMSIQTPNNRRPRLEDFRKEIGSAVKRGRIKAHRIDETTVGGVKAIRVRLSGASTSGRHLEAVQVWMAKDSRTYMVQFGTYGPGDAKRFRQLQPTFERMLHTLRFR